MTLTRWEVFKQDSAAKPHQAVGSVHAADAAGALLNARHVFARRPAAISLWVAPATAVYSWTAEELADGAPAAHKYRAGAGADNAAGGSFQVFTKTSHRRSMTFVDHVGEVVAESPAEALRRATKSFGDGGVLTWWLVPSAALAASAAADVPSWFTPAEDKTYKQQSAYARIGPGAEPATPSASGRKP